MSQDQVYENAGFGQAVPRGIRPALLVVDFSYGFTDEQYPTAADMSSQMLATRRLAGVARSQGCPVIFTTIAFDACEVKTLAWLRKAGGMASLLKGSRLVEIDEAVGFRADEDALIEKKGASAFFGTNLASLLCAAQVDTLIITGATTSGCVRASVVDAVQAGFNVLVPEDCCADRAVAPHLANLYDMQQKYADVCESCEVLAYLHSLEAIPVS